MKHTIDAVIKAMQHIKHHSPKEMGHQIAVAAANDGMTYQDAYGLFHYIADALGDAEKCLFMSSLSTDTRAIHQEHLNSVKY